MINLDLERGRADTHDDLFMPQNFFEGDGCQQSQYGIATNSNFAQQMPPANDSQHHAMELLVNQQPSSMNFMTESFPNSSQYEEIKDDLRVSNKEERIHHANNDLEELLRQTASGKKKVYSDALYKDLLRHSRRWVHN